MKSIAHSLFILIVFASLSACTTVRQPTLPKNSGNYGEIIAVAPEVVWNTSVGDLLREKAALPLFGLPQPEPMFNVVELKEQGFNGLYKTHRNILKIEINPANKPSVQVNKNIYAREQAFILIKAPDLDALHQIIIDRLDQILWLFHDEEIERLIARNVDFGSSDFNARVAEISGLNILNQSAFQIAKNADNFTWLRLDREKPIGGYQHQMSQGILIYSRPYSDTSMFSDSSIYQWKNEVTSTHVVGPKNSHMVISDKFLLPQSKVLEFKGNYAKEIRGLWRMDGYFMGGPFYALSFVDPTTNLQYMVEGYVYAPQFNKRFMLREVEAIVKSVQ